MLILLRSVSTLHLFTPLTLSPLYPCTLHTLFTHSPPRTRRYYRDKVKGVNIMSYTNVDREAFPYVQCRDAIRCDYKYIKDRGSVPVFAKWLVEAQPDTPLLGFVDGQLKVRMRRGGGGHGGKRARRGSLCSSLAPFFLFRRTHRHTIPCTRTY